MHRPTWPAPALALLLALPLMAPVASAETTPEPVVVAVIDTGVRADHAAFDYAASGGDGSGPAGQFVAWWDFTNERGPQRMPAPGETWDPRWGPYDEHGHGTGTASLVAGATVSLAPGTHLAIAKVGDTDGSIQNLVEAYVWAVDTVEADVVSLSIGSLTPWVGLLDRMDDSMERARDDGVLTVVAGGNGAANACGPAHTWTHAHGYSLDALVVGSLHEGGGANAVATCSHLDPEVASHGYSVPQADHRSSDGYKRASGTSFATPLVAGVAAQLMEAARTAGSDGSPARLESLIMDCARQSATWSYAMEGFGYVHQQELDRALPHARDGQSTCADPTGLAGTQRSLARTYHNGVAERGRWLFTASADLDRTWN